MSVNLAFLLFIMFINVAFHALYDTLNVMGLLLHCNACSHKVYVAQ